MPMKKEGNKINFNSFVAFVDFLLPFFLLPLAVVKDALVVFDLKVKSRNQYGDSLQLAAGSIPECLAYFPSHEATVRPLLEKLAAVPFGFCDKTVQLLDALIVLTILSKGSLRDKAQLMYSFFALAEPEGMLEYELAGLIQRVGNCLKKLGAIRPLDLSRDDARYLSILARQKEDGGYHKSLNFNKFYHWITHSEEVMPSFQFIRLLNRLFRVCRTMEAKANGVASLLDDVTAPEYSIGIPKYCPSELTLRKELPQIVYSSTDVVSFALPSDGLYSDDVFALVNKCQEVCYPLYEGHIADHGSKNPTGINNSKVYYVSSHQQVHSPLFRSEGSHQLGFPSFQVSVVNLHPGTAYVITLYTRRWRFSSLKIKTPEHQCTASTCSLAIFPSSAGVDDVIDRANGLLSHPSQIIHTGPICPIDTVTDKIVERYQILEKSQARLDSFIAVSCASVEGYYDCHWREQEKKLFLVSNSDVFVDGLLNSACCDKNLIACPCSPWQYHDSEKKLRDALAPVHCHLLPEIAKRYLKLCGASSPPRNFWQNRYLKVLFIQPNTLDSKPQCFIDASLLPKLVSQMPHKDMSTCNHLILLLQSPADLMGKTPSVPKKKEVDSSAAKENPKTEVLRGKHEILYGAHSDHPSAAAVSVSHSITDVREGGDMQFNHILRALSDWLVQSPGLRMVTLVSSRWHAGVDFSLYIDGNPDRHISHVNLEPTGLNPECNEMLDKMRKSFGETTILETGPMVSDKRIALFQTSHANNSPSCCTFEPILSKKTPQHMMPFHRKSDLRLNYSPKILYLSGDKVCLELNTSGSGVVKCTLYEVPCMVSFADVSRLLETEISSLYALKEISHRVFGNHSESKVSFAELTSFCAYCVVITTSPYSPRSIQQPSDSIVNTSALQYVHFRTFNRAASTISTNVLAGVIEGDVQCASTAVLRIKEQLDGHGRPLASPVYLFHNRLRLPFPKIDSINYLKKSKSAIYSPDVRDLSRITMVEHIGESEVVINGAQSEDLRSSYELQSGSARLSYHGKFARIALTMDTAKAFLDLANSILILGDNIVNLSVFVSKPLVHHIENIVLSSSKWEKSKHHDKNNYFPALLKALNYLMSWKQRAPGRDVQILCVANVSSTFVTYFEYAQQRGNFEAGIRHIVLPMYVHQEETQETISMSCGTYKLGESLVYTTFTYDKGDRNTDLPGATPFQLIYPLYHLHGYASDAHQRKIQTVLYKASVYVGDEKQTSPVHNHVSIKMIIDDVDNMELLVGPVIGQVTNKSVHILFEVNRKLDSLSCVLRPVGNPDEVIQLSQRAMPFQPIIYDFNGLERDLVYDILMPEMYGEKVIGKFRSLSSRSNFTEVVFLGDEHLENFPIAHMLVDELKSQQIINFDELRSLSKVRQYEKDSRKAVGVEATLDEKDPLYRRPWISLSERMKELASTTSTIFHLGSHALLSRLLRLIVPPLLKIIRKYNIDMQKYEQTSAVSKFYQLQLDQTIEDSLRLVWIVEPVLKDVFCNSSNIPLYNSEYWLSEYRLWGNDVGGTYDERDVLALDIIRKLFLKNLERFIYPLKNWRKSKNHFHVWREGSLAVLTLDQTSEQARSSNSIAVNAAYAALGREEEQQVATSQDLNKKKDDVSIDNEVEAKTFDASFMSEHQWKQIRAVLMEKNNKQLVLCMQFPLLPLELIDDEEESHFASEYGSNLKWSPKEDDVTKFLGQVLKWLVPKKGKRSGKTVTFVCVASRSYLTNVQDTKTGMKIQQLCLGKFSCMSRDREDLGDVSVDPSKYKLSGKVGTWRYHHRLVGLDEVMLDSDYCGNGGVFAGRALVDDDPHAAVFGVLRFWFDSWKPIGDWNLKKVRSIGPPGKLSGDAVMLVGPIVGAPFAQYDEDDRALTALTVPFLIELDRQSLVTVVATDLFSGTQVVIKTEVNKHRPTVLKLSELNIDTRYTVDFVEGIQNAFSSRFVVQTSCHWEDTNIMIANMEQRETEDSYSNDSTYIKDMTSRLKVPFNGICAALHINCHVDVHHIFDEVEFMPDLKDLLSQAAAPSPNDTKRREVVSLLKKIVARIMDRVRLEYRLHFSRPSYRQLLKHGFHLFMGRESYKEAKSCDADPPGSLIALLNLIASRVNQEYFDQLIAPEDEVYSAWPRIEYTEEMRKAMKLKEEEEQRKQLETAPDPYNPDNIRILTVDDYLDKHILNVPLSRQPYRTFFDNAQDPVECVLFQWMQNFVPPPTLWKTYTTPNKRVSIESFCYCNDAHIRDIHEKIVYSDIHQGSRLVVLPNLGPLMNNRSLLGYKMSQWTRRWVKEGVDRSIHLVAPSHMLEGTYNYSINYEAWPESRQSSSGLQGTLQVQTLHSIYTSNEKEISKIKKEKLEEIKEKTKSTSQSRGALAKKKKDEAELKEKLKIELQEIFNAMTPDGYVLFENRVGQAKAYVSEGLEHLTVGYSELKTVGTILDKSPGAMEHNTTPKLFDYLQLPLWVTKFVPATAGVFAQDEVNIVIRQEPHSRRILEMIETDEGIVQGCKKIYLSSRLSDLSHPPDMREYDLDVEGVKEMFLEEAIARVWREALPVDIKSRLFSLTDDFIRTVCLRRAFTDLEQSLSSAVNFCKAIRRMLLANALMFLAFKMSRMERWKYILNTAEFQEDTDNPYLSDEEGSDVESKDDETELTTKDDETETKMTESVAELPSVAGGTSELKSVVEEGPEQAGLGGSRQQAKMPSDSSTVEGLFDRSLDNVSAAPSKGVTTSDEPLDRQDSGDDQGTDQDQKDKEVVEGNDEEGEGVARKDTAIGIEEDDDQQEVLDTVPLEDQPLTAVETIAQKAVTDLYNDNWRRIQKRRNEGEKLSFMTTRNLL